MNVSFYVDSMRLSSYVGVQPATGEQLASLTLQDRRLDARVQGLTISMHFRDIEIVNEVIASLHELRTKMEERYGEESL